MDQISFNNSRNDRTLYEDLAFFEKYKQKVEKITPSNDELERTLDQIESHNRDLVASMSNIEELFKVFVNSIKGPKDRKLAHLKELNEKDQKLKNEIIEAQANLIEKRSENEELKIDQEHIENLKATITCNLQMEKETLETLAEGNYFMERY
ncbi:unnamed protein product [Auanema sp. JU1783]|nr:unnamed protein product [Auanema sp. JU1783]